MSRRRRASRGMTLVELVMTIVVIAFALAGILRVLNVNTAHGADPMIATQAHALAQSYLEEILLLSYSDPSPGGSEAGETRPTFDDVDDYHALAANGCVTTTAACPVVGDCACDQFGNPVAELSGYTVGVTVLGATVNGAPAKEITVAVGHSRFPDLDLRLTAYRTEY